MVTWVCEECRRDTVLQRRAKKKARYLGISHVVFRALHRCRLNVPKQTERFRKSYRMYVSAILGDMRIKAVLHELNRERLI